MIEVCVVGEINLDRGSGTTICRSGDDQVSLPPVVKAVDDVGAGYTFDAAFIHLDVHNARDRSKAREKQ